MASNELPGEMGFELREHDVRIERGPWVYWVRGVKTVEPFRRDLLNGAGGPVEALVLAALTGLLELWWRRRPRWKVGVVRVKGSRWGPSGRVTVVHKEVLPRGVGPEARIAQVVIRVQSGEFDQDVTRGGDRTRA